MNDHRQIETARMLLRPLASEHGPALHEMFADPEAMRFWPSPPHRDLDETHRMIAAFIAGSERAWSLCPRDSGDPVGLVYYLGNVGRPGMGYILHPRAWGKGLATEAARAALDYGFTTLGFDQVELWVDTCNLASQRVAERTGFKRRSIFRQKYPHEAASHEKLVYGLRIEAWRPGTAPRHPSLIEAYSLQPVLGVADVRATAEYYRDKLGFMIGDPATYGGVWLGEWMATGASIHFSQVDAVPPARSVPLYLNVGPEIDALHATYKARGIDVLTDVEHQPWGARMFAIRDCNGYVLRFSTPG
jgi:[ribosomal protein S5]-alanine N-acetyltransferase